MRGLMQPTSKNKRSMLSSLNWILSFRYFLTLTMLPWRKRMMQLQRQRNAKGRWTWQLVLLQPWVVSKKDGLNQSLTLVNCWMLSLVMCSLLQHSSLMSVHLTKALETKFWTKSSCHSSFKTISRRVRIPIQLQCWLMMLHAQDGSRINCHQTEYRLKMVASWITLRDTVLSLILNFKVLHGLERHGILKDWR